MSTTTLRSPSTGDESSRKATLICSTCGRAGPIEEAWLASVTSDRERYVCPDCETTLLEQPRL